MSNKDDQLPLFWWSEIKFNHKHRENYGDLLSKYLAEKISGREVKWVHPKKQPWYRRSKKHYVAIGSILHHVTNLSIVWGSGIIDRTHPVANATFTAVRGPQTKKFLHEQGYCCPSIYGDPAILLPVFFKPEVKKTHKLGIIPHYKDFREVSENYAGNKDIKVIDLMTTDVEKVTLEILGCEQTISSSLHGIIVSHAYNIPSLWVKFSDRIFGDGIKYDDYLESVEIESYEPQVLSYRLSTGELQGLFSKNPSLPEKGKIEGMANRLLGVCPFA